MTETPTYPEPNLIKQYEVRPPFATAVLFDGTAAAELAIIDLLQPHGASLMVNLSTNERYVVVGPDRLIHKNIEPGTYVLVAESASTFPEVYLMNSKQFETLYRPLISG